MVDDGDADGVYGGGGLSLTFQVRGKAQSVTHQPSVSPQPAVHKAG